VTVKIKYADFRRATRSQSQSPQITSAVLLHQVSLDLVRTVFPPAQSMCLVGVAVSNSGEIQTTISEQFDLALNA
jgi:DNA polymerase IV